MKDLVWLGTTLDDIRNYPFDVKQDIGYNLDKVQRGLEPSDWKPVATIGAGVKEIRIHCRNEYRVLYVAKFDEAIYILNSFVKKTQQTPVKEIALAKKRYAELIAFRRAIP
jgi:phage-related protein